MNWLCGDVEGEFYLGVFVLIGKRICFRGFFMNCLLDFSDDFW